MARIPGGRRGTARGGLLLLTAIFLQGCFTKPFDPVAPTWDVGLTAPLSLRTYTLSELAAKNPAILTVGSGDGLLFRTSVESAPAQVGGILSLAPFRATAGANIGALEVGAIPPIRVPVRVPGVVPGSPLPPLSRVSLPPASVTIPLFDEVRIETGTLTLRIDNFLPVPLTIDSTITLRDAEGGIIVSLPFPAGTIPAGGSLTASAGLAGSTITSRVAVANVCVSTSQGISAVPSGDLIVATISTSSIVVSRARLSSIPPQRLMEESRFAIPFRDSSRVREVLIASGELLLDIASRVAMNMSIHVRFPQLVNGEGIPFADSLLLGAGATVHTRIPLGGLRLRSTDGGFIDELEAITTADLYEGSGGLPVTVAQEDSILISFSSSAIVVDHFSGALKPTVVAVDQRVGLQLGAAASLFRGEFLFPSADLTLIPRTDLELPMELNLVLQATDASGRMVSLQVPVTKSPGPLEPITFVPGDVGAFLSRISGRLPDTLRLVGTVVLNPDYDTTRVTSVTTSSTVGAGVDLSIPLRMGISGGFVSDTVVVGDTTGDGGRDFIPAGGFFDNVTSGKVHFELESHLPVRAGVKIALLDEMRRTLLVLPQTAGDSLVVAAAVSGGVSVAPARTSRVLQVSGEEAQLLRRAVYCEYGIGLDTPGGGAVTFRSTDGITVRLWCEMNYRVDP